MARTVGKHRRNEAARRREERRRRRAERSVSPEPRLDLGPFEDIRIGCQIICAATALQSDTDRCKPVTWPYYLCVNGHVAESPAHRGHQIALLALETLDWPRDRRVSVVTLPPDTELPLWNVHKRIERGCMEGGIVCKDLFALTGDV